MLLTAFYVDNGPHLPVWDRLPHLTHVVLARHPERPQSLDYLHRITDRFVELRGDRIGGDDAALVSGLAVWHGMTTMFLCQQKGRTLANRLARNFGMMRPEGYRKAVRLAEIAGRFHFPIVCLIDTPGACPGVMSRSTATPRQSAAPSRRGSTSRPLSSPPSSERARAAARWAWPSSIAC